MTNKTAVAWHEAGDSTLWSLDGGNCIWRSHGSNCAMTNLFMWCEVSDELLRRGYEMVQELTGQRRIGDGCGDLLAGVSVLQYFRRQMVEDTLTLAEELAEEVKGGSIPAIKVLMERGVLLAQAGFEAGPRWWDTQREVELELHRMGS